MVSLYYKSMESHSIQLLRFSLTSTGGNRQKTAEHLGLHRNVVARKMKKYGLEKEFPKNGRFR